jgi:hypothetical protein
MPKLRPTEGVPLCKPSVWSLQAFPAFAAAVPAPLAAALLKTLGGATLPLALRATCAEGISNIVHCLSLSAPAPPPLVDALPATAQDPSTTTPLVAIPHPAGCEGVPNNGVQPIMVSQPILGVASNNGVLQPDGVTWLLAAPAPASLEELLAEPRALKRALAGALEAAQQSPKLAKAVLELVVRLLRLHNTTPTATAAAREVTPPALLSRPKRKQNRPKRKQIVAKRKKTMQPQPHQLSTCRQHRAKRRSCRRSFYDCCSCHQRQRSTQCVPSVEHTHCDSRGLC